MSTAAETNLTEGLQSPAVEAPCCSGERTRANVLGVGIDIVTIDHALALIADRLNRGPKGYVCAVDVHAILQALHHKEVADALANAAIALPDGAPTVWTARMQRFSAIDHVTGPDIMRAVFSRPRFDCFSHFFYGGKPGVADDLAATLQNQFPWARVLGTYTPPFRDLTVCEETQLAAQINALRPDIIWVGISTPRQDMFMRRMLLRLDTKLMFGVGAAFDFLTGRVRECPRWVKRAGFHWLHRLVQEPGRLWRRNLRNSEFLWHIALQLTALRNYPLRTAKDREHTDEFYDSVG